MHAPNRRSSSRGASLLGVLVLLAILGGIGVVVQSTIPQNSYVQSAAAELAVGPTCAGGHFEVVDGVNTCVHTPVGAGTPDTPPAGIDTAGTGRCVSTTEITGLKGETKKDSSGKIIGYIYPVYYACTQKGSDEVTTLKQACNNGFNFTAKVGKGGNTVNTVESRNSPDGKCSIVAGSEPSVCTTEGAELKRSIDQKPSTVSYEVPVTLASGKTKTGTPQVAGSCTTGQVSDVANENARLGAIDNAISGLDNAADKKSAISGLGLSDADQNALNNAYTKQIQNTEKRIQANNDAIKKIEEMINNRECDSASCREEREQRTQLTQQNTELQAQMEKLKANQAALTPEKPPTDPPPGTCTSNCSPGPGTGGNTFDTSGLSQLLSGLMKGLSGSGSGSGSSGTQSCGTAPAQPAASSCTTGSWYPVYSGSCMVGWRCTGSGADVPTASLSCSPKVADVGMSLAISYSCSSGTATGSGFTASGSSGSATAEIETPPSGTNTATYGLTCTNSGATSAAQCSVEISKPSIVLVVNPKIVDSGKTSLIGWVTSGMQSCVISSPDQSNFTSQNASNTSASGTAESDPISKTSVFKLHCTTLAGGTKDATTTVRLTGDTGSGDTISVSSSAVGTTVKHGDSVTITWQGTGLDSDARVALWVVHTPDHSTPVALIKGGLGTVGSYTWSVPASGSTCPSDGALNICGSDLVAGTSYAIEADVYTPSGAYVGDGTPPSNPVTPVYSDYADTGDFTMGE